MKGTKGVEESSKVSDAIPKLTHPEISPRLPPNPFTPRVVDPSSPESLLIKNARTRGSQTVVTAPKSSKLSDGKETRNPFNEKWAD